MIILKSNNTVDIDPAMLLLKPFKKVWDSDKSSTKEKSMKWFALIYLKHNFKSSYRKSYSGDELEKVIIKDLFKNKPRITKAMREAEELYANLQKTKSFKLVEAAESVVDQITKYFKEFSLEGVEDKDKAVESVMKNLIKVDEAEQKLRTARERVKGELAGRGKANRRLNKRELPKDQR